jgi:ABC-type nitrate/sulfonate/bicarbonate transport system ATPase subunit
VSAESETKEKAAPDTAAPAEAAALEVELRGIVQEYPAAGGKPPHRVLENVDLHFDRPGINMLLGPSGCGKSTVLRMMGGVRPLGVATPTQGTVKIGGKPCDGPHDETVMVFQRYANRPDLTVVENVSLPFRFALWKSRIDRKDAEARVDEVLEAVGLAGKKDLRPSQLSGGQNQRVALARALVLRPKILLMDEPFGALDALTREEMQELLARLLEQHPCLVVFVTHDVSEALILGDRVIMMSGSPATIVDDFVIDEPRPRSDAWLMSSSIVQMKDRILATLHESKGHGQVRVSF